MSTKCLTATIGVTLILSFGVLLEYQKAPNDKTHVTCIDVGQGDGTLILTPGGKKIIIDGGPDWSLLEGLGRHVSFFERSIDLLVLSHPNFDHLAALPEVLRRYRVARVVFAKTPYALSTYSHFLTELREQNIDIITPSEQKNIEIENGVTVELLWPRSMDVGQPFAEVNDASVLLRLVTPSSSMLFTGDMEEAAERALLKTGADLQSNILKIAHHGSRSSTSTGFLLAVKPKLAVISVGRGNSYGHPHPWILQRLQHFSIPVRRTDLEGDITIDL